MPIDDERRRFGKAKGTPSTKPQIAVATEDESGARDGIQESLERLQELLLLQRGERTEFREEEEKRIKSNKEAMEHAWTERNEKYERLQQAFERINRWKDEEETRASGEESKEAQGTPSSSYLDNDPARFGLWMR